MKILLKLAKILVKTCCEKAATERTKAKKEKLC